jgi:Ser/Thr protein kinase RdoA (MazF antagonist)
MNFSEMTTEQQIESLLAPANAALSQYGIENAGIENINHEYNSTFAVTTSEGTKFALRMNINSGRTESNIAAEVLFINSLAQAGQFSLALPMKNRAASFVSKVWHDQSDRELFCVLFSWLEGDDLGDEPTPEQVYQVGRLMAQLHEAAQGLELPSDSDLPTFDDFMWHVEDFLLGPKSQLSAEEQIKMQSGKTEIEAVVEELFATSSSQLIHADLHGWNLKWHNESLSVFDFDDSGIGLPVQDMATTIYYLDTEEQDAALKAGYASVRALPEFNVQQMQALLLQRRIHLLNYLYETQNPEHRDLLPKYQEETMRRIDVFLGE